MKILFSLLVLASTVAFGAGGIMLRPSGMYWSHEWKGGDTQETKDTIKHYDISIGLGFKMDNGIYIGGTYILMQEETKHETITTNIESKENHTAYGPTLGYVGDNFFLLGTYHLSPIYVTGTDASKVTYSGGTGYQADLGYMFWVSSSVGLGPQVTYYHAEFKTLKGSTGAEQTLPSTAAVTDVRPMVAFAFMF